MKTITLLFTILFVAGLNNSRAQGAWTKKANFGGGNRSSPSGFSIGNKGYLGTGYYNGFMKDFWEYDPALNTWTQKADFGGVARENAVGLAIGNKGYIGTGYNFSGVYKDFWEYDPDLNIWKQKADFGGTARYYATGFSIGDKGYIGIGKDALSDRSDFWEYDPASNTWTKKADFGGGPRDRVASFTIDGKGYIGTGWDGIQNRKDLWQFDPSSNTWIQMADFGGTARRGSVGFAIGGSGFLGMGYGNSLENDLWQFNPAINSWTQTASFPGNTWSEGATAQSINDRGYVGTGINYPNRYKDWWEYTPDVCNGLTVYGDADSDGYGNAADSLFVADCKLPDGYVSDKTDCNDSKASIHPSAKEVCNGIDDNCNGIIDEITGLTTTNITAKRAQFNWHTLKGSLLYVIKYKLADPNITSWSTIAVTAPVVSVTVSKLHPNSKYVWKIASNCGTLGNTGYSGPVRFKTAEALSAGLLNEESIKATGTVLSIYPNPVTDILHLDNLKGKATISIITQDGHIVDKKVVSSNTYTWHVKNLAAGTYFMKVEEETKVSILKFIKQ